MRRARASWFLIAGLAATGAPHAIAQKSAEPIKATGTKAADAGLPSWIKVSSKDPALCDVDFPGGTLAEFYRGLTATPEAKNLLPLVVSEQAERVRLQALSLRDASVFALYQLPANLIPGVTFSPTGLSHVVGASGKETLVGAYVVGVDPRLAEGSRPAATFDLDFPGGTMADYAAAVRAAWPGANLAMLGGAEKARVPAMKFRDVTVEAAMRAVESQQLNEDGTSSAIVVRGVEIGGSKEGLYRVVLESGQAKARSEARVHVWSLAPMLAAGVKIEDALSAIEAALAVDGRPTTIKYHEATMLLIVRGSQEQHDVIDTVIHEVEYTVTSLRDAKAEGKKDEK